MKAVGWTAYYLFLILVFIFVMVYIAVMTICVQDGGSFEQCNSLALRSL